MHLIIEPPRDPQLYIASLHGVERRSQIVESEYTSQQIAASDVEGNAFHAHGKVQVKIQIVADLLIVFVIELVHQRVVGIPIIQGVVHQIPAQLDVQSVSEYLELVSYV